MEPHAYKFDLSAIEEPEDLWTRLLFGWVKNLAEQNAMNLNRLGALDNAVTQLDGAIAKLLPEQPDDLTIAMEALKEVQAASRLQSTRSLDNVEKLAVIAKQIVASQRTG